MQPVHIDRVLRRIVAAGAPVANDALRHMNRMFRMAVRNHWIERNPAADFNQQPDVGLRSQTGHLASRRMNASASQLSGVPRQRR